jgi:hypothetical protein
MTDPITPTAPNPPAPATTTPAVTPVVEPTGQSGVSASEAATLAKWTREDLAAGKISGDQAEKIFSELNTPLAERRLDDPRSEEVKLLDQHFAPATPEAYHIPYGTDAAMTPEMQQFDTSARAWLTGAEFPRELGNALIVNIERVAQQTKHMNENELESYGRVEYEKLQRAYGDTLEEKLNTAGRMVVALDQKTPGLKNLLKSKGLGDNAMIASLLIQQSERYWARRKGR